MAAFVVFGVGFIVYFAVQSIYRLYFHPLRHIPGPKLAAITHGYEFYFNIIKRGMFIWEVERMHEVYGPIVRINPREVHIRDPDYYEEIYASNLRRREKDPVMVAQFGLPGSAFASVDPEAHRQRRMHLDKFFTKGAVTKIEHLVQKSVDRLVYHFENAHHSHSVVSLDAGFAALTADVIYQYVYGFNPGNLEMEGFNENVRDGINGLFQMAHLMYFFPWMQKMMDLFPLGLLQKLNPSAYALASLKKELYDRSVVALNAADEKSSADSSIVLNTLAGHKIPQHLRTPTRLMNEGFALAIGGTETTARSLAVGIWHILTREDIRSKMREELKEVMPTPDSRPLWHELEQLPYLSAVVKETLRLSTGIANRAPRVAPTEALVYKDYTIPPGTTISETNYFVLMDPSVFPNPHEFNPERWIHAAANGKRLDRYLVNFGKGSRICQGFNLAYAEIFLVLAALVRRFEMELYETPKGNIELARDFGTPYPDEGNLSVRALITGIIKE